MYVATDGKLGDGSKFGFSAYPELVKFEPNADIVQVKCGFYHSLALLSNGKLYKWGWTSFQQTDTIDGEKREHSFPNEVFVGEKSVFYVSAGRRHSLAITTKGEVYSWGYGLDFQLGHDSLVSQLQPTPISSLKGKNVVQVSCGWGHNMALCDNGDVYSWGWGEEGALGLGKLDNVLLPQKIPNLSSIVYVDCGSDHSLAINNKGELFAWGSNEMGQIGQDNEQKKYLQPTRVEGVKISKVLEFDPSRRKSGKIASGFAHTVLIDDENVIHGFGWNSESQLGFEKETFISKPRVIEGLQGQDVVSLACGRVHSLALTKRGDILGWGSGAKGKLGNGDTKKEHIPCLVDLSSVKMISCGQDHSLAVTT